MRTWILGAGLLIAEAIRPNYEDSSTMSFFMIGLLISAIILDMVEFKK